MASASQVLEVARTQLGYVEGAGNNTKYGSWYGLNFAPWCAMFVSWVADQAGATSVIPKHAYTPSGAAWFKARGQWGNHPRVGAIVYYDIAGLGRISHVGIVEAVNQDGSWIALEGNTDVAGGRTGGRVMRQLRRKVGSRGGFGYPAYDGVTAPAVPSPPKQADPVAGPSGSRRLSEDGDFGPATKARLQESLNRTGARPQLKIDGDFGPASKRALQARLNHTNGPVGIDGQVGKQTIKALQRNVGATPDGDWGRQTTTRLQYTLNHREL